MSPGLIVIDVVPTLVTLKTKGLATFVWVTGPLTIASPEASITGGAFTWIVTESAALAAPSLSVTVRLNVRSAGPVGAVNDGVAVSAPVRVTAGPDVCTQANDAMVPSGSVEPFPFRFTVAPESTVWSTPAFAVGGIFAGALTLIVTESAALAAPSLSVTVRLNVRVAGPVAAVNHGVDVFAPFSATVGPYVCAQA